MHMFLLVIVILAAAPVMIGFIGSRKRRREDRQHFVAFVGFSGSIVAVVVTIAWLIGARLSTAPAQHPSAALQTFELVFGYIGIISSVVAFVAGLLSTGIQRVALVMLGPLMGLIYVVGAFYNFGA